ncbi:MAG: DUF4350 domain-containing protein [Terrimicrobiaceae bacterium]
MKRLVPGILLVLCVLLLGGTLYALLQWRFAMGDVYPPYSSLRADPLGTMALHESLQRLPGLTVTRDHRMTDQLPAGRNTTYLHLAADPGDWRTLPPETIRTVERFLVEGGRLVVMFAPGDSERDVSRHEREEKKSAEKKEKTKDSPTPSPTPKDKPEKISLTDRWGIDLAIQAPEEATKSSPLQVRNVSTLALPAELAWHSAMVMKKPGPGWTTIYSRTGEAVLAERKFGEGSMVIATDSYFVSNEAMLRDRQPGLLAWLIGANHQVIFDEAHLGIMDSPGIAALARKYRLQGVAAALFVLVLLFVWKNSSSLSETIPPRDVTEGVVAGREASAGFIGLLRRNIPPDAVLESCLAEWNKTFDRSKKYSRREKDAVQAIVAEEHARPKRDRDPVSAYRRICAALHRGKPTP